MTTSQWPGHCWSADARSPQAWPFPGSYGVFSVQKCAAMDEWAVDCSNGKVLKHWIIGAAKPESAFCFWDSEDGTCALLAARVELCCQWRSSLCTLHSFLPKGMRTVTSHKLIPCSILKTSGDGARHIYRVIVSAICCVHRQREEKAKRDFELRIRCTRHDFGRETVLSPVEMNQGKPNETKPNQGSNANQSKPRPGPKLGPTEHNRTSHVWDWCASRHLPEQTAHVGVHATALCCTVLALADPPRSRIV